MTHRLPTLLLLAALASCSEAVPDDDRSTTPTDGTPADTDTDSDTDTDTDSDTDTDVTDTLDPDGPALQHLEFFQVVSIPVLWEGTPQTERNAPVVADRAAVLRATLDVPDGWQTQDVELIVTVQHDGATDTYSETSALSGDDTLMVELPAEAVDPDATYTVEVIRDGATLPSGRFPESGEAPIEAEITGPIKIHLVPFELNGFVPDTSQAIIDGYRDAVFAVYPATEVLITVGDVVPAPADNLRDLLFHVGVQQEQIDVGPTDTYYFGIATGVATREEFEGVTGSSQELDDRAGFAIGAAFGDQKAEDTLIHELGHLHYLLHADCGGAGADDPSFPYSDAGIGVEGYDVRTGDFVATTEAYDMMAYCYPRWISDYHYDLLVDWVQHAQGW